MKTKNLRIPVIFILLVLFSNLLMAQSTDWEGNEDEDWNNAANWSDGVPDEFTTATILAGMSSYPDLTDGSTGECDILTLLSDPFSGTASILGNENISVGSYTDVESYLNGGQWHMVSSMVVLEWTSVYYFGGDPKVYLTEFDEETNSYVYITDLNWELEYMTGYMVWIDDDQAGYFITYFGDLNSGLFSNTYSRSAPGPDNGWNMVGNPYPSTIDWDAFNGWYKENIDETIYIINDGLWASWSEAGGSTNGGSNYIAHGQGFFISVTDDGSTDGILEMDEEVRVNTTEPLLKKTREITNYIKLLTSGNGRTDEIIIRFLEGSTTSFDGQYDAYKKLTAREEIPQIYTQADVKYAVNILPSAESLPLHFLCGLDGEYSISVAEINQIDDVWLEDLTTGEMTNLAENNYSFSYQSTDDPARFVLHFSPVSVQEEILETVNIYSFNNQLNIKSAEFIEGEYSVFNLSGQQIITGKLTGYSKQLNIHQKGYYLVKVRSNGRTVSKKVFIN